MEDRDAGFHMKIGKQQMTMQKSFNSMKAFLVVLLFFKCFGFLASAEEIASNQDAQTEAAMMIENWKTITPELLRAPENAEVIRQLKTVANERPSSTAVVLLLRYGDDESIQQMLAQLRVESPGKRNQAMRNLRLAANPKILTLLEDDLNRQESTDLVGVGDVGTLPLSTASASIFKATILENPVFPPEVKEWAKQLPTVSHRLRDGVRVWWKVNKAAVVRGDYQAVIPVEPVTGAATAIPDVPAMPAQATPITTPPQAAATPLNANSRCCR